MTGTHIGQPAFRNTVDLIERQLSSGAKTMTDLRRSNPDVCSTTIGKALAYLKAEGRVDSGDWPRSYWKIKGSDNVPVAGTVSDNGGYVLCRKGI